MTESDASYFRRRAEEERAAADKAESDGARYAHLEMAERYEELASSIDDHAPGLTLRIVNSATGSGRDQEPGLAP